MERQSTLTDLLKLVLGLDAGLPVTATQGFAPWTGGAATRAWPPVPADDRGRGLWLIDTRDRPDLSLFSTQAANDSFDAAIVLSGSGPPGSPLRRLLRRLRRRTTPRMAEHAAARMLAGLAAPNLMRMGFDDGSEVPIGFDFTRTASTGAAFLLTRTTPFTGPLWSHASGQLGAGDLRVVSFQLRARGAAVVIVEADDRRFVLRFVPAGPLQDVVVRNHSALLTLRSRLDGHDDLLRLIPAPLFADSIESTAVLGETCLRGTLAWQVVLKRTDLRATVRNHALRCLADLRSATLRHVEGPDAIRAMLLADTECIQRSTFASTHVRDAVTRELRTAEAVLTGSDIEAHASHGDYGYGNILVDAESGEPEGIIDWDTARHTDFPGIDRVNLEVQIRRTVNRESFPQAVQAVWRERLALDALEGPGGEVSARALFGVAVCRYITRAMSYPELYSHAELGFAQALDWLAGMGASST